MSKVTRNIIYNGLGQGLSALLSIVAVHFVFRQLGGDALGLIYFSLAFSAALSLAVGLGICESAVREVASHYGKRPEYIESFVRTSSLLYWIAYVILAIIAYTAAPSLIHHWVKLDSLDSLTATKVLRILSLGALLTLPMGLYKALLVGLQHLGISNLIDVAGRALQQGGIFLILLAHGSLFHVADWIVGSMALQFVAYGVVCAHFFSVRALLLPRFSRDVVKQNFRFASGLMTISVCSWVVGEVDKVMVSKLLPLALLGLYTFARGVVTQGAFLTSAIGNAIFPHFSALHGGEKPAELRSAYNKMHDLICLGGIPLFAALPFAAQPLFSRVFNPHAAQMLLLPTTFLCIGYFMNGTLTAPYIFSLAVGRADIGARQGVLSLLIVPPVSAAAIYWFGLNGAGFSWVLYHIFGYSYGVPRICRECIGISPQVWYFKIVRILALTALTYGTAWVLVHALGDFTILWSAVAYLGGSAVYAAGACVIMGQELRESLLDSFRFVRLKIGQALWSQS